MLLARVVERDDLIRDSPEKLGQMQEAICPDSPGAFQISQSQSKIKDERQDPRFREVAVTWIHKCPHEPERAGSVDSWAGRLIQIAERLNVSPHILIRCVPDGVARPRGYVRGFESGAYPLPAWTEDPAHKQTFYDWLDDTPRTGCPTLLS